MAWFWTFPETNGTVQLMLRVTNRDFTEDLKNSSSPAYIEFVQDFTKQVKGRENPPGIQMHPKFSKNFSKFLCDVLRVYRDGFGVEHPK